VSSERSCTSVHQNVRGGCGGEARSGSDMRRRSSTPTVQNRIRVRALALDSSLTEYPTCTPHRRQGGLRHEVALALLGREPAAGH